MTLRCESAASSSWHDRKYLRGKAGAAGFGTISEARPHEWRLHPSDSFGGRAFLELTAQPRGREEPRASVALRLVAAEPALASIEPDSAIARIGGTPLRFHVRQTDRFGNTVGGAPPAAEAGEGRVATYVPPDHWDREDVAVEMRWPGRTAHANVILLPRLARFTISPKVGALSNFGQLHSPVAALEAAYRTDGFGPELGIATEVAWYFVSQQQSAGQLGTAQSRDDFLTVSALLSLRLRMGPRLSIWAGAGPSIEAVASRLQIGTQPRVSETGIVPGAVLALGIERRFAHVVPFAELRWSWHGDPALSSLTGAISAFSFVLGNRFELL